VTILVLTTYIRKDAIPGEKGLFERIRAAFG
jgi:hypothetical protein